MPVYDVTLQGYDGSGRPESDVLVKWVKAPSVDAIMAFLGENFPLHEPPTEMPEYPLIDYVDGVDIKLSPKGVLLGCNPSYKLRFTRGLMGKSRVLKRWLKEIEAGFQDSPEKAKDDRTITNLYYEPGCFRQFFTTPFEQYAEHIGKPFHVLRQTQKGAAETKNHEAKEDMYQIQFEDGTTIDAWGHEVCILNYPRCKRITGPLPDYMK